MVKLAETQQATNPPKQSPPSQNVVRGDVLRVLQSLPSDQLFDVVIADPPYNIGKDFGNNHDAMPLAEYVDWTQQWLHLCFEHLTEDGLIYVYGFAEILAHVAVRYPLEQQRWLAWHYTNKAVPSSTFWQRSHESLLCLWHGDRPTLEIDQIREPYTEGFLNGAAGRSRAGTPSRFGGGQRTVYQAHKGGALPRDVLKAPALAGGAGFRERWFLCKDCGKLYPPQAWAEHRHHDTLKHPTQKPMAITRKLIRSRINGSGGAVLVPFAGSGSECVVAQELGLNYLGIEINPDYVDFAHKWLLASDRAPCHP